MAWAALDVVWWAAGIAMTRPDFEGPSVWPLHRLAVPGKQPVLRRWKRPWITAAFLEGLGRSDPRPTHRVSRVRAGGPCPSQRFTCSRCNWDTRRRGKWRKQSRALVKATVTAAPPPPAPARRSLPHIIRQHERLAAPTLADPGQRGRPRASEPDKIDRSGLPWPCPLAARRFSPCASRGRSEQGFSLSPDLSAAPLGGGNSFTESSLAGNDGRRNRFFSESRYVLTHPSLLLDKRSAARRMLSSVWRPKSAGWHPVAGS